jgi:hypothetical protein
MVEHHPEWDGFMLNLSAPSQSRWPEGQRAYDRVKPVWLRQIQEKPTATVLHNAAWIFRAREPYLAERLMKQAIRLEPEIPFYVERLGIQYGHVLAWPNLTQTEFADAHERKFSHATTGSS